MGHLLVPQGCVAGGSVGRGHSWADRCGQRGRSAGLPAEVGGRDAVLGKFWTGDFMC